MIASKPQLTVLAVLALGGLAIAQGQFGRGCSDLGDSLTNGACAVFVQYVRNSNDYYYDKPDSDLQAYISKTPAPTTQCCFDATAFVNKGCSCNNLFVNYVAAQQGYTAKTLAVVARAIQLSSCAAASPITNPCDSSTGMRAPPAAPQLIQVGSG